MSRSSPRFKLCKFETLPAFYFESFNSADNCNSTYCPFLSLPPGHPCDILMMLSVCRCWWILSSEAYLFSLQRGSILCLLALVFSLLSALLPDFPFPAFVSVVTADWGSLRVLLWEPCVGKHHCFRPRRAWLRRDLRRSLGRHPLSVVSGPLRASVYCVLLKH